MAVFKSRLARHIISLIALVAVGFGWAGLKYGSFTQPQQLSSGNQSGLYSINHFIDGDTIAVNMNGAPEDVRFIGVDTPETHKPHTPVQCYGPEAAAFTKTTIGTDRVRLESDNLSANRDRYNRLLRYVYLPDGRDLDELLIQQGYGFYYPYFPFSKSHQFHQDELAAQASKKGLWIACHPTPTNDGGYTSNAQGQ